MLNCVRRFDPAAGCRFNSYAGTGARNAMSRFIQAELKFEKLVLVATVDDADDDGQPFAAAFSIDDGERDRAEALDDVRVRLAAALAQLPAKYSQTIRDYFGLDGPPMTVTAIAAAAKRSVTLIRTRIDKGLRLLSKALIAMEASA
jgi:DNA-directed RNA polymerase sigma subunit (sigma70/sigma32)